MKKSASSSVFIPCFQNTHSPLFRAGIMGALFFLCPTFLSARDKDAAPLPGTWRISPPMAASEGAEPSVWTEPEDEPKPPRRSYRRYSSRFFWQIDIWSRDGAFDADEKSARDFGARLIAAGYDSASVKLDSTGGLGLRFGVFVPTNVGGLEAGGSLGYVLGPSQDVTIIGRSASSGDGKFTEEADTDFARLLFEALKEIPLSSWVGLRIRGGVGIAAGRIRATDKNAGTFTTILGFPDSASYFHSWRGATWEFMPSLLFIGRSVNVEVGVGVAGFPKMKETGDFNEFKWNPVGLRLGLEFN